MERIPQAFESARPQLQTLAHPLASWIAPQVGEKRLVEWEEVCCHSESAGSRPSSCIRCLALPAIGSVPFAGYLTLQDLIASSSKIGVRMVTCHEKVGAGLGSVLGAQ